MQRERGEREREKHTWLKTKIFVRNVRDTVRVTPCGNGKLITNRICRELLYGLTVRHDRRCTDPTASWPPPPCAPSSSDSKPSGRHERHLRRTTMTMDTKRMVSVLFFITFWKCQNMITYIYRKSWCTRIMTQLKNVEFSGWLLESFFVPYLDSRDPVFVKNLNFFGEVHIYLTS